MFDLEESLNKFHHALLELHLEEGVLICPKISAMISVQQAYGQELKKWNVREIEPISSKSTD